MENQIKKCVTSAVPNECCGLVFGKVKELVKNDEYYYHYIAKSVICIPSDKTSMISFLIKNIEKLHEIIIREQKLMKNMQVLSIFHSHPTGNYPSTIDEENMKYLDAFGSLKSNYTSKAFKNLIWLIIDSSTYDINGFIYFRDKVLKVKVIID